MQNYLSDWITKYVSYFFDGNTNGLFTLLYDSDIRYVRLDI